MKIGPAATVTAEDDHLDSSGQLAAPRERTPWLLAFLCFLLPVLPTNLVFPGPLRGNGSPARLIAVLLLGLAVLGFVFVRRTAQPRRVNPGVFIILVYLLLWLVPYAIGVSEGGGPDTSAYRTRSMIAVIAYVGVALFVVVRIRTPRERNILLGCLLAGLAFLCLVGTLQSLTSIDLRLFFKPPGFVQNIDDLQMDERQGAQRVKGTSMHAIEYSVLAAVTVPLALHFARYATTRNLRVLSAAACALALVAMPTAVSRSGLISLLAALLVYMFAFRFRLIATAVAAGAIVVGAYFTVLPHIANALVRTVTNSGEDLSVKGRTQDYAVVSKSFREHPIFGVGLGGHTWMLDNEWLMALVQGGLFGLAAMMVISGGSIFGIAAALRSATSPRERDQAYMLGAMAVGILVSSATFDSLHYQQLSLVLFIVFGLLWSQFNILAPESDRASVARGFTQGFTKSTRYGEKTLDL